MSPSKYYYAYDKYQNKNFVKIIIFPSKAKVKKRR